MFKFCNGDFKRNWANRFQISLDYVRTRASQWNSFKLQPYIPLLTLSFLKACGIFPREDRNFSVLRELDIYRYLAKGILQIGYTTPESNLKRFRLQVGKNL